MDDSYDDPEIFEEEDGYSLEKLDKELYGFYLKKHPNKPRINTILGPRNEINPILGFKPILTSYVNTCYPRHAFTNLMFKEAPETISTIQFEGRSLVDEMLMDYLYTRNLFCIIR